MSFHKQTFHQRTTRTKEPTKRERLDYQIELINNRLKELGSKEFIDYGIAYGGYRLETKVAVEIYGQVKDYQVILCGI